MCMVELLIRLAKGADAWFMVRASAPLRIHVCRLTGYDFRGIAQPFDFPIKIRLFPIVFTCSPWKKPDKYGGGKIL